MEAATGALAGLRVLELAESLPGAFCGRQFALWGAEVVVLEAAEGSPLRRKGPWAASPEGPVSLLWDYVAAGKRSQTLEAAAPSGAALQSLAASADVLLVDRRHPWLARLDVSAEGLSQALPGLVVVELSPFGASGPFSEHVASELVVQALAGYLNLNGAPGAAPLKAPGHILAYAGGVSAFVAALGALVGRERHGGGAFIEASEFDVVASMIPTLRGQYTGTHAHRSGGPGTGVRLQPCADGFVSFAPPTAAQLPDFEAALGVAPVDWPSSAHGGPAPGRAPELMDFLSLYTRPLPAETVFLGLLRHGVPCGRAHRPGDLVDEPQLADRGFFHALEHPQLGRMMMPGAAARLSRTPASGFGVAPAVGEADGDAWTSKPARLPAAERSGLLPLDGVRLIDLTQAWIGPYAAWLMTELGADAVKIESHLRPDVWRQWSVNPVPVARVDADVVNASPNYNSVNCNKRSLCLDLKSKDGRDILLRLACDADLVMENYTPRVMERMLLDHANLSQRRRQLVTSSFCGYGKTGPLSDFKANGTTIEAMAGWDHFHRYPDGDPMVMGFYQADAITGLQMAATTLVALLHACRTGEGQAVDGAMYEAAAGYIGEAILEAEFGEQQTPFGNRDLDAAPSGVFRCAGEDAWIAITVADDDAWRRLVGLAPELGDAGFATAAARHERQDELEQRIEQWTRQHAAAALEDRLQRVGVAAGRVRTTAEVLECPHLGARAWFRSLEHADVGVHLHNGPPFRFPHAAPREILPSPRLGEHGREILKERLGLADVEIDRLEAEGVTGAVLAKRPRKAQPTTAP